jgi:hypothetical protein
MAQLSSPSVYAHVLKSNQIANTGCSSDNVCESPKICILLLNSSSRSTLLEMETWENSTTEEQQQGIKSPGGDIKFPRLNFAGNYTLIRD